MSDYILLAVTALFALQLLSSIQERRWLVKSVIAKNTAELAVVEPSKVKFIRSDSAIEQDNYPLGL